MKLIECYIENFGRLCKQKFSFNDGLNCICQNNGEGKSTLAVFIKVMLFGMSDTKRAPLAENDRKHYMPWQGGTCGGYLIFSDGKRSYRIERTFSPKAAQDTYKLVDLSTGQESRDYPTDLGRHLFGIDADAFERTVFLSERNLSTKSNNETVSEKLSDLSGTDGDIGAVESALDYLEEKRKFYQKRGGAGKIFDIRAQISDAEQRLVEIGRHETELRQTEERIDQLCAETAALDAESKKLLSKREAALISRTRQNEAAKYKEAKEKLDSQISRKDDLLRFFGGTAPTFEEVERTGFTYRRAVSVIETPCNASESDTEYQRLSSTFGARANSELIAEVRAAEERLRKADEEQYDAHSVRYRALFKKRTPAVKEIENALALHSKMTKKDHKGFIPALIIFAIAIITLALGAFINSLFFAASAILILISAAIGVVYVIKEKRRVSESEKKILDFLLSVSDTAPEKELWLNLLFEMKLMCGHTPPASASEHDKETVRNFVMRFAGQTDTDICTAARVLISQYEKYERLTEERSLAQMQRTAEIKDAERLLAESRAFLARFGLEGEGGFTELRKNLKEYTELSAAITAAHTQLASLGAHTAEIAESATASSIEDIDAAQRACDEKRAQLGRELGALTKRKNECEYELLERDAVTAQIAELKEKLNDAIEEHRIIILTEGYLSSARDSMTAKYLGQTKESLSRYSELINGTEIDGFELDTAFELTRIDAGAARSLESYSKGTRELYAFAARLALSDSLYGGECPLLILDDPFTAFDDARVRMALRLLVELGRKRQIIYFTCSDSRTV